MRLVQYALAALPLIALSHDAAADDEPGAATGVEAASAEPPAAAVEAEAAPPASRFPRAVIARPLTLPAKLAVIGADATANNDFSVMGGAPIVGYGVTDDLEVLVPYTFATKEFEIKGSVNADVGYKLLRGAAGGKLEAIARARVGYDLAGEAATPLLLGVHVQYNFTDKLAILSGYAGTQQLKISLAETGEGAMAVTPIDLSLPVGIGYQATPELYLQLDTKLFQLDLSDSANVVLFADATPVAVTAVYNAMPALDLQATIGTDLSNEPGDALTFLIGARYYAGAL